MQIQLTPQDTSSSNPVTALKGIETFLQRLEFRLCFLCSNPVTALKGIETASSSRSATIAACSNPVTALKGIETAPLCRLLLAFRVQTQ